MKKTQMVTLLALVLSGCLGYRTTDGTMTGQVKKVTHVTPLICPAYWAVDISLGILRNGIGSMSTQDVWVTLPDDRDVPKLADLADRGGIVKVTYDNPRLAICTEDFIARAIYLAPTP